jgi:hypothetical protein
MKSVIPFPALVLPVVMVLCSIGLGQVNSRDLQAKDPNAPSSSSVEDYSVASLNKSHLQSDPPELVEKSEGTGFTREYFSVQWRPGDNIDLYVIRPTNIQKPPVAIYLYGHPSETDRYQDDGWCQRVTAGGYAAVGFVPALTGHRYHSRPMKQWFVSELQEALGKSTHDVQMVLNYLSARGDFDMDNVGMFGVGAGGTIAIAAASVDSRIKAIDLLDPWGDWPDWMAKSEVIPDEERAGFVKPEFLKKIAPFDPIAILPTLKTAHIRLIQLNEDFVSTPEEAKKKIEAAIPASAEKRRYESNAEFFGAVASGGRAFDWLKLQLKATESKEATAKSIGGASSRENKQEFQTK